MNARYIPLFINHRFPVACNGFIVGISLKGRILVEIEDGEYWAYGINPGGVSGSGTSMEAALENLRALFHRGVNSLAETASDFEGFSLGVRELFGTNEPYEKVWTKAAADARKGSPDLPGMGREPAETAPFVSVELLENMSPSEANYCVTVVKAA